MTREEAVEVVKKNWPDSRYTLLREALETLIPELKESEEERIIKWIANYIHRGVFDEEEHPKALKAIEWLEKQKEQKLLMSDGEIEDKKRDIVAAIREYYPADYAEYLTSFLKILSPEDNSEDEYGQKMLGVAYKLMYNHIPENLRTQEFWDSLKFMREYTGKVTIIHSYEKPAEWNPNNEDVTLFNKAVTTNPNLTPSERAKLDIIRMKFKHCNGNTANPAEWSEEDEKIRKALIWHLKADVDFVSNGVTKAECLAYLDKQKAQKQEWSEEDEEIFNNIIEKAKGGHWIEVNEITWLIAWFKSLRPQSKQEWSEEDKQILHSFEVICQRLIENPHGEKFEVERSYAKKMLSWLKSLRPQSKKDFSKIRSKIILALHHATNCADAQNAIKETGVGVADVADWLFEQDDSPQPSWKPGEKQMESLNYAIAEWDGGKKLEGLYDLRNDLKKLM